MSTIFAVKIKNEYTNIAKRHNGGRIELYNGLVRILNPKRKVYSIDNTAQGIFTIKDLLKAYERG